MALATAMHLTSYGICDFQLSVTFGYNQQLQVIHKEQADGADVFWGVTGLYQL